jgi:hypothetical protein
MELRAPRSGSACVKSVAQAIAIAGLGASPAPWQAESSA